MEPLGQNSAVKFTTYAPGAGVQASKTDVAMGSMGRLGHRGQRVPYCVPPQNLRDTVASRIQKHEARIPPLKHGHLCCARGESLADEASRAAGLLQDENGGGSVETRDFAGRTGRDSTLGNR